MTALERRCGLWSWTDLALELGARSGQQAVTAQALTILAPWGQRVTVKRIATAGERLPAASVAKTVAR
jgi:hypothetical protein